VSGRVPGVAASLLAVALTAGAAAAQGAAAAGHMLAKRPDVRESMIRQGFRVAIMAESQSTTDLPEQRGRKKPTIDDPRLGDGERAHYARIAATTDKECLQTPEDLARSRPTLYAPLAQVHPDHHIPTDVYHARNIRPAARVR
jgi:hypothetical protein